MKSAELTKSAGRRCGDGRSSESPVEAASTRIGSRSLPSGKESVAGRWRAQRMEIDLGCRSWMQKQRMILDGGGGRSGGCKWVEGRWRKLNGGS